MKMLSESHSKDQPFYIPLSRNPPAPALRELLEKYSEIPAADIDKHLEEVRDDAWNLWPYPSIGLFIWLDLGLSGDDLPKDNVQITETISSAYQTILSKLKNGGKFLDVGCMFAQDTRRLVYDGVSAENVYGTDLHGEYFKHGYKLFRDEGVIPRDHFIAADILDAKDEKLRALEGNLEILNATHVLHVFSIEEQHEVLKRFVKLLKAQPGVMITGRLTGHVEAGYHELSNAKNTTKGGQGKIWEHNVESFKTLWEEVEKDTGTKWDVKAWFWRFGNHTGGEDKPENWHRKKEHGIVTFIVTRL